MAEEFKPDESTSFEVTGPGGIGAKAKGSRSIQIVIWVGIAVAIGFGIAGMLNQAAKLDIAEYVQREILRQIREIKCILYLPEADRAKHVGQAASCKAAADVRDSYGPDERSGAR